MLLHDDALRLTFQRTARLAARLLHAPYALIYSGPNSTCQILAATGLPDPVPPSFLALVEQLRVHEQAPFVIGRKNPSALAQELGIAAAACVPMADHTGEPLACLCVLDREAREWGRDDLQVLDELCASVAAEIELRTLPGSTKAWGDSAARKQELHASDLRFAAVFRAHPVPMTIHDFPEGRYLDVNEAWVAQTGFSRQEAIGKTSAELNVFAEPSLRPRLFKLLREQGYVRGLEGDMRMKNGEIRTFLLTSQQVNIGGHVRLLSGIQDITGSKRVEAELRASEEQMRLITHTLPIFILHCDTEFRYKFVNTAYAARLGLTPDAMLGKRISDVLGDEVWQLVEDKLKRVLAGDLVEYEALVPYPGIGARFMRSVNVPERDKYGAVRGLIGVLVDITQQKQMEEERSHFLKQSLEQAEQLRASDRRKDEFLAMLAHELRNPLAPINTAAQLLPQLVREGPEARRIVDIVQRQVNHMTRLVEDLLDISRITLGKITLRKERVELGQIVHAGIELTRPLIDARHHQCIISIPAEQLVVAGDAARLVQVISNLLNNAAKYTEEHGRIQVSVERQDDHGVIKVSDNGIGINTELLPHVFELFTQSERTLDRSQGGLGIGLALVKSLVTMHGGSVEAFSRGQAKGSEFVVCLPLLMHSAPEPAADSTAARAVAPWSILVADDNADAAQSLAMLLRMEGHQISVAYDGAGALELARRTRPDFLLLDIGLPGTDGYTLAAALRALPEFRDATLIAVTGYGLAGDRERSKAAGYDHHLVKPVDIQVLRALLAQKQK